MCMSTTYISLRVHCMYYIVFRMYVPATQTLLMYPTSDTYLLQDLNLCWMSDYSGLNLLLQLLIITHIITIISRSSSSPSSISSPSSSLFTAAVVPNNIAEVIRFADVVWPHKYIPCHLHVSLHLHRPKLQQNQTSCPPKLSGGVSLFGLRMSIYMRSLV